MQASVALAFGSQFGSMHYTGTDALPSLSQSAGQADLGGDLRRTPSSTISRGDARVAAAVLAPIPLTSTSPHALAATVTAGAPGAAPSQVLPTQHAGAHAAAGGGDGVARPGRQKSSGNKGLKALLRALSATGGGGGGGDGGRGQAAGSGVDSDRRPGPAAASTQQPALPTPPGPG